MALIVATIVIIAIVGVLGFHALRSAAFISPHEVAPVYDPEEAIEFVWSEIPSEIRDRLNRRVVALILEIELEFMKQAGAVMNGRQQRGPVNGLVIGAPETIDHIVERAAEVGMNLSPQDVYAVIEAQAEYLVFIGAIGGVAK